MEIDEKYRIDFKDNTPKVVHFNKHKAPRGAEEITIDGLTFWVEECTYLKAMSKMYTASIALKPDDESGSKYATAMLRYVLEPDSDSTFAMMLYGFSEWHKYIDMGYTGSSLSDAEEEQEIIE